MAGKLRAFFSGKKKENEAILESSIMIQLYSDKRQRIELMRDVVKTLENEDVNFNVFNDEDDDYSIYFTPYSLERFFQIFKENIEKGNTVSFDDEIEYQKTSFELTLYQNIFEATGDGKFKFKEQDELQVFDNVTVDTNFLSITMTLNKLLFFVFTEDQLNNLDLEDTYQNLCQIAELIKQVYLTETGNEETQVATIPTLEEFQDRNTGAVYIPALVSAEPENERKQQEERVEKEKAAHEQSQKQDYKNYDRFVKDVEQQNIPNNNETQQNELSYNEINSEEKNKQVLETVSEEKKKENKDDTNPQPKADETSVNVPAVNSASPQVPLASQYQSIDEMPTDLVERQVGDLLKDESSKIQLEVHFPRFNVDDSLAEPKPIEEAIKDDNFDAQAYVIQQSNTFKSFANSFMEQREDDLKLAFKRMMIDAVLKANKERKIKTDEIRKKYASDKPLIESAKQYYVINFEETVANFQAQKDAEIQDTFDSLEREYNEKKEQARISIENKYKLKMDEMDKALNSQALSLMNQNRADRNKEMDHRVQELYSETTQSLQKTLENYSIEYQHKMTDAGNKIFTYFVNQLEKHQPQWIDDVSKCIVYQVKLNDAHERMLIAQEKNENLQTSQQKAENNKIINELRQGVEDKQGKINELEGKIQKETSQYLNAERVNQELVSEIGDLKQEIEEQRKLNEKQKAKSSAETISQLVKEGIDRNLPELQEEAREAVRNELESKYSQTISRLRSQLDEVKSTNTSLNEQINVELQKQIDMAKEKQAQQHQTQEDKREKERLQREILAAQERANAAETKLNKERDQNNAADLYEENVSLDSINAGQPLMTASEKQAIMKNAELKRKLAEYKSMAETEENQTDSRKHRLPWQK